MDKGNVRGEPIVELSFEDYDINDDGKRINFYWVWTEAPLVGDEADDE